MLILTDEERKKLFGDPIIVQIEVLVLLLCILNVFTPYYLFKNVIPFPITITWIQLVIGTVYAFVLGIAFIAMITLNNILLAKIKSLAYFPIAVSFVVVAHHFTRFFGCGQVYRPNRWSAILLILVGYIIFICDSNNTSQNVVGLSIAYGITSALYRGAFMERALHETRGVSNELQATLNLVGIIILPIIMLLTKERKFIMFMPKTISSYNILLYGCLSTISTLPMAKNIVSNKLIRETGQPMWRLIELATMAIVFVASCIFCREYSIIGFLSFALVFGGRALNSLDAIVNERTLNQASKTFNLTKPEFNGNNSNFVKNDHNKINENEKLEV